MKNKNKLLLPKIVPYMNSLDEINDDEIQLAIDLLDTEELYRVEEYCYTIRKDFTRKRLFLFICSLIDFKEKSN